MMNEVTRIMLRLLQQAEDGRRVMVVGEDLFQFDMYVGKGSLHARRPICCYLMAVQYDTVWFINLPPPKDAEEVCLDKVRMGAALNSCDPVFLYGKDERNLRWE